MKKHLGSLFLATATGLAIVQVAPVTASTNNYESYLESWDPDWNSAMTGLPPIPSGSPTDYDHVSLDICFASYTFPGLNGVQFSDVSTDTNTVIDYVHGQNGKAKISYGGASYAGPNYFISQTAGWPDNIPDLVSGIEGVMTTYDFDGIDFDIEDPQLVEYTIQEFADQLFSFLTQVRAALPDKNISLTIPAQGWNTYWEILAKKVAAAGTVNYINFMEYDIWLGTENYVTQIQADLLTYTSPTNVSPAPNYAPGWGIPPGMIQLGLMPGNDDNGNYLSVNDAKALTNSAIEMKLAGVMTWDLNRDAGTNPTPPLGTSPYAFSNAIRQIIEDNLDLTTTASYTLSSKTSYYRKSDRRGRILPTIFVRQEPPLHGYDP